MKRGFTVVEVVGAASEDRSGPAKTTTWAVVPPGTGTLAGIGATAVGGKPSKAAMAAASGW